MRMPTHAHTTNIQNYINTHTCMHTQTHTHAHTHTHTHTHTISLHDVAVLKIPSESPNPKDTKNTREKLSTLLKKIKNRLKNIDNPVEMMNRVNLFTYLTVRPAVKLPMALPNAHTATANPTYLTPIH